MRAQFVIPTLPRNPALRGLVLVGGTILLVGVVATGFVIGLAVLVSGALVFSVRHWLARRRASTPDPSIIEGEYTVVTPRELDPPHAHQ